ncbi:MAG TPA: hypothetical protein VK032_01840 [Burkholderiaceae bacterium]|nr:hypothetical protein [Burkholderiaceae bacterium]
MPASQAVCGFIALLAQVSQRQHEAINVNDFVLGDQVLNNDVI